MGSYRYCVYIPNAIVFGFSIHLRDVLDRRC